MALNKITLRCSDGKEYEVDGRVVAQSPTIRHLMVERNNSSVPITVPNVDSESLVSVSRYCYMHADGVVDEQLKSWDDEFVSSFASRDRLVLLLLAANHLQIKGLVKLCAHALDASRDEENEQLSPKKRFLCGCCCIFLLIFVVFAIIGLAVVVARL